jgi:hypothetical protein
MIGASSLGVFEYIEQSDVFDKLFFGFAGSGFELGEGSALWY